MQIEIPKTQEEIIIKITSDYFGLDIQTFTEGQQTDRCSAYQRQICLFLIKERTLISFKKAGEFFGMAESSAKSAVYRIQDLITVDRRTKVDCKEIKTLIDIFTKQKANSQQNVYSRSI